MAPEPAALLDASGAGAAPAGRRRWWAGGALACLAALALYLALAPRLPDLGRGAGAVALYAIVPLALAGAAQLALYPVAGRPWSAGLAMAVAAAIPATALALADVEALAGPLKVVVAAGLGFALATLLDAAWQLAVLAGLACVVDIVSVAAGPTNELVNSAPRAVEVVAVHLPAWGGPEAALVGTTDFVFLAVFLAGAIALGLRVAPTAVAMVLALEAGIVISSAADRGLPALPLMGVALIAVNADLIFRRRAPNPRS